MHFNYCLFYVHEEKVESSEEVMTVTAVSLLLAI